MTWFPWRFAAAPDFFARLGANWGPRFLGWVPNWVCPIWGGDVKVDPTWPSSRQPGEDAATYPLWRALVLDHRVAGNRVFDTRLVAAMRVHGIARVLTFNIRDFAGYDDVEVLDPAAPG